MPSESRWSKLTWTHRDGGRKYSAFTGLHRVLCMYVMASSLAFLWVSRVWEWVVLCALGLLLGCFPSILGCFPSNCFVQFQYFPFCFILLCFLLLFLNKKEMKKERKGKKAWLLHFYFQNDREGLLEIRGWKRIVRDRNRDIWENMEWSLA